LASSIEQAQGSEIAALLHADLPRAELKQVTGETARLKRLVAEFNLGKPVLQAVPSKKSGEAAAAFAPAQAEHARSTN